MARYRRLSPCTKRTGLRRRASPLAGARGGLGMLTAALALLAAMPCIAANGSDAAARCEALVTEKAKSNPPGNVDDDSAGTSSYRAHYSQSLAHCFYLQSTRRQMRSPALKRVLSRETLRLWDADQARAIGDYDGWQDSAPLTCQVQGTACNSRKDWDRLTRPYLKD